MEFEFVFRLGFVMDLGARVGFAFGFLCLAFVTLTQSNPAEAQSNPDQTKREIVMPAVRSATDCIIAAVARRPGINAQSPDGPLSDAIRSVVASGGCDDAISRMIGTYDSVYGRGSGDAFFSGSFGNQLPRVFRSRLALAQNGYQNTPLNGPQNPTQDRQAASTAQHAVQPAQASPAVSAHPTVSNPVTNANRPKTPAEIEAEKAFNVFMGNVTGVFVLAGGATFILFLIGLGSRWVVFADSGDLGRTASIVISPVVTALAVAFEIWRLTINAPNTPLTQAFFFDHWTLLAIMGVGVLVCLWGLGWTLASSIRFNGWVVGPAIAILKLTALVFVPLAFFGAWHLSESPNPNHRGRPNIALWILFGLLIWFGSKLVNGERVFRRQGQRPRMASLSDPEPA